MNIAVIGSGNMGSGLGKIWAKRGHQVIFSFSRDMGKLSELARSVPNARAATPAEAAKLSDVILLSVRWANVEEAINAAGSLKGGMVHGEPMQQSILCRKPGWERRRSKFCSICYN